jgi:hypothetical protein
MSSAPRRTRGARVPGRIVVIASLIVIAAAIAGAWYTLGLRPSATRIVDLLAIDREYAVLVRDVARDPGRSFLSLISAERGEVWGAMIPGYGPRNAPRSDVAATAGVISVRVPTGGVPYIHVFAAARGAKLGRYALLAGDQATALATAPDLALSNLSGQGQSFELVAEPDAISLLAIDLEQGVPLWRRALGPGPVGPLWLRERHLLVRAGERVLVLDRRTGEPALGHADGVALSSPCALAERVYGVDRGAVQVLSLASGALRDAGNIAAARLAGVCGTHGDLDVLAVATADGATALVAVDPRAEPRAEIVRWRVELGAPLLVSEDLYLGAPQALAGPMPRFLPVLVGAAEQPRLLVIDLEAEAGRSARAGTPTPELAGARILRGVQRFHLWTPHGPTLAVIDGATGALTAAVALPGMAPTWPRHMADGRIWVHGGDARPGEDRDVRREVGAWLVLHDETLAVMAAGQGNAVTDRAAGDATDVRVAFARALGLP